MNKPKKLTVSEKLKILEQLLHNISLEYACTMNHSRVKSYLNLIDDWSYAHRKEATEKEQAIAIEKAYRRLTEKV
jgi:hypothetical protein